MDEKLRRAANRLAVAVAALLDEIEEEELLSCDDFGWDDERREADEARKEVVRLLTMERV